MYWSFLFATIFCIYGILTPYNSILIRSFGFSHSMVGILLGLCEGAAIASPFVFGYFADKSGRYKPAMLLGFALAFLCAAAIFAKPALWIVSVLIVLLSFAYRSIQPLTEAVCTVNMGRAGNYGKYRVVGSLSFFLTVVFLQGTQFLRPNTSFNILIWVIISAVIGLFYIAFSPRARLIIEETKLQAQEKPDAVTVNHGIHYKLWTPMFILGLTLIFLSRLAMSPVNSFIPLYVTEYMDWDAVGLMFALSSGAEMPFILLSTKLIKRFGDLKLIAIATFALFVRLLICALFPFKAGIIIAQLLHSLSYGVFHPSAISFISRCVPPSKRALGMSLYFSIGTGVPTLLGNAAGGFIVEYFGFRILFGSFSIFALIALFIYFVTRKHAR
ncbi:MAG: MFS transporter [Termitinemataceae bacterium]|nr:MAG: MFS transporter [Termitinemataceae bacterium]